MAHGYVCIFLATVLFSAYQPSTAEIGKLLTQDVEQSFKPRGNGAGQPWRTINLDNAKKVYYVCQTNSWLVSTQELDTTGIQELTVKVLYKYKHKAEKASSIISNKTVFTLGVLIGKKKITFLANGTLDKNKTKVTSTELVPVNYTKLTVLIRPQNNLDNCMIVYSVQVTYKFCIKKTFNKLAEFPKTFAPRNGSIPLKVEGKCKYGRKIPVAYCNSEGEWSINDTHLPCSCAPGEVMSSSGCIKLSSIIQEVKAVRLSNTRAIILWKQEPKPEIQYNIICKKCQYSVCDPNCPKTVRLENKTSISGKNGSNVTGLQRGCNYLFTVVGKIKPVNENYWNETSKQVWLRALPEKVKNLTFTLHDHDRIALTWLPPSNIDSTRITYEIGCRVHCLDEPCMTDRCEKLKFIPTRLNLFNTNVTITGFRNEGLLYVFEVRSKHRLDDTFEETLAIQWNSVAINYTADFKKVIPTVSKSFNVVDVVIGVSVLIFAVIVTIVATRCYNRWKRRKHTLSFDSENPEPLTHCEVPLTDVSTHYVDPSNYDSVENVLRKFTTKLNEKNLKIDKVIGKGEFGVVSKGYLEIDGKERTVAVKSLRSGLSAKLRRDFLAEASVMGQFKDPNVISLHGVIVRKHTVKIVMEFMSNGSMDKYLVENNGKLTTLQLLGMARGIASGMNYLSRRNFIHRDLAARNILVDENLSCKVSDFGLTREICQTSNYETSGGKIPIRWTAPEVIKYRKSFISSDVWSYGVVLWEIMSFGQRPYWEWDNFRVLQEIETGYRLPAPLKCPKTVHSLMLHCWEKTRSDRPTFLHILDKLDEWIRSPETIHHSPATKAKRSTMELIEPKSPIHEWLDSIKMGKYASNFAEAGYNRLSQVVHLTEDDLSDMGITLVGHRHKIHQSIPLVT